MDTKSKDAQRSLKQWAVREDRDTLAPDAVGTCWEVYDPAAVLRETAKIASVYRTGEAGKAHADILAIAPEAVALLRRLVAASESDDCPELTEDALKEAAELLKRAPKEWP